MFRKKYDSAAAGRKYAEIKKRGTEEQRVALIGEMTENGVDWPVSHHAYLEAMDEEN